MRGGVNWRDEAGPAGTTAPQCTNQTLLFPFRGEIRVSVETRVSVAEKSIKTREKQVKRGKRGRQGIQTTGDLVAGRIEIKLEAAGQPLGKGLTLREQGRRYKSGSRGDRRVRIREKRVKTGNSESLDWRLRISVRLGTVRRGPTDIPASRQTDRQTDTPHKSECRRRTMAPRVSRAQ